MGRTHIQAEIMCLWAEAQNHLPFFPNHHFHDNSTINKSGQIERMWYPKAQTPNYLTKTHWSDVYHWSSVWYSLCSLFALIETINNLFVYSLPCNPQGEMRDAEVKEKWREGDVTVCKNIINQAKGFSSAFFCPPPNIQYVD